MVVKRWRIKAMDRGKWKRICEGARALQELKGHGGGGRGEDTHKTAS
jgi:hypothetical protein